MTQFDEINPEKIYTAKEASVILTLSIPTIRNRCNAKVIPAFKVGRDFRIIGKDIIAYINQCKMGGQ